jgi:esterase
VKIRNGATELNVVEDGDPSAPPILMLHGITSYSGTWEWLVPTLADRFRVLRLDFRGHGASDRAAGDYGPAGYVGDAVAVCDAIGQPVVVIGHSLGGATGAALAQQHPDRLLGAFLEDPPLGIPGSGEPTLEGNSLLDAFRLMRESIPQLQASGITRDVLTGILAAAPSATGGTFGELLHADAIDQMAASMLAVDASVLDPVLEGTITSFLDADAPFGVPTVVVCADPAKPDAVANPGLAARFADISPATEVLTIDGAGHLIHDELASRDQFRTAVVDFLDRLTA